MHTTNQFAETVLPFDVRLCLNSLVGITHHSNEQIYENYDRNQHINSKCQFEEDGSPLWLIGFDLELAVGCLAEDSEEEVLKGKYGIHFYWNSRQPFSYFVLSIEISGFC